MKLVSAKCPSCGADIKVDQKKTQTVCEYCKCQVIVDDAIQKYKLEVSGEVEVKNLPKLENYLKLGDRAYEDEEFQEALDYYSKAVELDPDCCHAVLRKGFSKCFCCSYEDLDIEYALKSMKVVYKILSVDLSKNESRLNSFILDCTTGIFKIERILFLFSNQNLFDLKGIEEYNHRLWQCLRFYQYLYSILPEDWIMQVRLLNNMIASIDTILEKRRYWSGEYFSNGKMIMTTYQLSYSEKKSLISLRKEYVEKRGQLDPSYLVEEKEKTKSSKRNVATFFQYFVLFLFAVLSFGCFMTQLVLCGFLWLFVIILFLPRTRSIIISKNRKMEKPFFVFKIGLLIVTIFVFAFFSPFEFEKKWISEDGMVVEFQRGQVQIEMASGKKLKGTYSHSGSKANYLLNVRVHLSDSKVEHWRFRYTEDSHETTFCLLENEECQIYFTPEEKNFTSRSRTS